MKKSIHPEYKEIEVVKTNGDSFKIKSCLGAKHAKYFLEIDPESHPAWSKQNRFTGPSVGNVRKFEKRYPGLDDLK